MLKRRLILALTINEGQLYRTKRFVPDRSYSLDFVDLEGADELVVLDVTKQPGAKSRAAFIETVERLSEELFLPLAVGGHVRDWSYARDLMNAGADKIVVGMGALAERDAVGEMSSKLGSQSVVAGLKFWTCYAAKLVSEFAVNSGAGELLVQSVPLDGSLEGYDNDLIREVSSVVSVPVIAMSGCGTARHMVEGFEAGASACATSNIFHFTSTHVRRFKQVIEQAGIAMRAA